jgi:DNA-binding transcriptional regulator YiaG
MFTSDSLIPLAKCAPEKMRGIAARTALNELLRLRAALGWSQLRMAQELHVSTSTVENWERGISKIPAVALVQAKMLLLSRRVGT